MAEIVFINGRFLTQRLTGVQRYAREMVTALDRALDDAAKRAGEWVLVAPAGTVCDLPLRNIRFEEFGSARGHIWEQTALALRARRGVLLSLGNSGPLLHRRQIVTIHDAAVYRTPQNFSWTYGFSQRLLGRLLSARVRITTVSRFSQAELSDVFGIPRDRIKLTPNGAEHLLRIVPDDSIVERLALKGGRYFLCVGSLARNKNLDLAAEAFRRLGSTDLKLVIVGNASPAILGSAGGMIPDVVLARGLSDSELAGLYRGASALVFPSTYEGFGIPPLEAMVHGCPVIAARIPPVVEVCGEAALYFDPTNAAELEEQMARSAGDQELRVQLQTLGRERAAQFPWRRGAAEMIDACEEARACFG